MTENNQSKLQHEAGDRAFVIGQTFSDFVVAHPFVSGDARLKEMAARIEADLADLYQAIWQADCGADTSD